MSGADHGQVTYEAADGIATITLDRPAKRNALSEEMCEQLRGAWLRFRDSETERAAILTGAGGMFTAGLDITGSLEKYLHAIPDVGVRLEKPVIAAVAGSVVGGGVSIVAMCDLCVAAEDTRFLYPEGKLGLTIGLIAALAARIPHKVAMEIMLLGAPLDVARAYQIGLVNRVVTPGTQMTAAREMAQNLAENAPMVLATLKRLTRETLPRSPVERARDAMRMLGEIPPL